MANIRYDVPCPSCEASVPIRSTSVIGKKIECPKCKYRFVAPEPPGEDDEDDAPAKSKKKEGNKKSKKEKSSTGMIVGVVLGVVAVGALVLGGWLVFGDSSTPPTTASGDGKSGDSKGGTVGSGQLGTIEGGSKPETPPEGGTPPPEGGSPTEGGTPGGGPTPPPPPPKKAAAAAGRDVTNLLPGETVAVYRVNMDRTAVSATPLANAAVDNYTRDLFQSSFTINADNVATYIHCVVNPDREPFAVIRTKSPFNEREMYERLQLEQPKNPVIRGKNFYLIKSNPFIEAVSRAFTVQALAGLVGLPLPPTTEPAAAPAKYALCVYDTQTLLISTELTMERFLTELQDNGYPPYKSELVPTAPPPAPPADPNAPGGTPGATPGEVPMGPGRAPAGPGRAMSDPVQRMQNRRTPGAGGNAAGAGANVQPPAAGPEDPAGGQPPAPGAPAGGRRLYTSLPTYRTIDPALKRMLNQIEEDEQNPPAILYAEMIDQRLLNSRQLGAAYEATGNIVLGLLSQIKIIGLAVQHFKKDKGEAQLLLEYVSADDATKSVTAHLLPVLTLAQVAGQPIFGTTIALRNNVSNQGAGGNPTGPGGLPGGPGGLPRGGEGPTPPGGFPPPSEGGQPGGGFGQTPVTGQTKESAFEINLTDNIVTISALINWTDEKYASEVLSRVNRTGSQIKGRMAVLSGEADYWQYLSVAAPKVQKKAFPRGTIDREMKEERYRLPYPPEQRVSFMADLLPYIGRNNVRVRIQDKKVPWYAKENLPAAEIWIPEFLVPYYPQDSWRANHPLADGVSLGGTNYAALAGIGLDAARYDPAADSDHAKKVGIIGYEWGSKPEEVKDGLSNTIFMVQTAPGVGRAWIAGGGSTVLGVEDNADPMKPFVHKTPTGTRGTYVLMADGSVRWLKEGTDPKLFKAMVTRAGGESLTDLETAAPKLKATKPLDTELRPGGAATAPAAGGASAVDAEELKKFQGKWKASVVVADGKELTKQQVEQMKFEVTIEGSIATFTELGGPPQPDRIVKLDPKAAPKQLDILSSKVNKTEQLVYEFVGEKKLRLRGAKLSGTRPSTLAKPEKDSKDIYIELDLVSR